MKQQLDKAITHLFVNALAIGAAWFLWIAWPRFAYGAPFSDWEIFPKGGDTVHVGKLCEAPHIPPMSEVCHPVSFLVPNDASGLWSVTVNLEGWKAKPTACENPSRKTPTNHIQIDICPGHYPDVADYAIGNANPKGWNGKFFGLSNAHRLSASLSHVLSTWSWNIDWMTLTLQGQSYGGTGALLLPGFLQDVEPNWPPNITMVSAMVPNTLFVKNAGAWGVGQYWKDPTVRLAWGNDPSGGDWVERAKSGLYDRIYHHIAGAKTDTAVVYDIGIFSECDKNRVPCFGWWSNGTHSNPCPEGVDCTARFSGPDSQWRRDSIMPVFHDATSNNSWWSECGSYNLGLEWDSGEAQDTGAYVSLPIRYRPRSATGCLIAQPPSTTTGLTLRNIRSFNTEPGQRFTWSYRNQTGQSEVTTAGELTITNLAMPGTEDYAELRIEPTAERWQIVYSRQPRHTTPITDQYGSIGDASNWQHNPDVARIYRFSETDIVLDDLQGNTKVVYDCTTSPRICAAQDAKVSPDGKKLLFGVCTGSKKIPVKAQNGPMTDLWDFDCEDSDLHVYEFATGKTTVIDTPHTDRQGEWINNKKIAFVSDRAGTRANLAYNGDLHPFPALQLYTATIEGDQLTGVKNIAKGEQFVLNPYVETGGRIYYFSWWGAHPRTTGSPRNRWVMMSLDQNGANPVHAELCAHGSVTLKTRAHITDWVDMANSGEGSTECRAIRMVVEISPGYFVVINYYRGNSGGPNGAAWGFSKIPGEGAFTSAEIPESDYRKTMPGSGRFTPSDIKVLTPGANDQDNRPKRDKKGRPGGRVGAAAPFIGDDWLIVWNRGVCYEHVRLENTFRENLGGELPCKRQIMRVKGDWVQNPFDPEQWQCIAACEDKWHADSPQWIATYQERYGQPMPEQHPPLPPGECYLQVVNATEGELVPIPGRPEADKVNFQGNALDCAPGCNHALVVEEVKLWDRAPTHTGFQDRKTLSVTPLESDGSVRVKVPCETPLLIGAHTTEGEVSAQDNQPLFWASGETRTCHGCHDGHSEGRIAELESIGTAVDRFAKTKAGQGLKP